MRSLVPAVHTATPVATKICGITNVEDAFAAVDAGAEMLGFNFYDGSRRFIDPDDAGAIIRSVRKRGRAECVGVFVDATPDEIREIAARSGVDAVQLHGNETPDYCDMLRPLSVIKALRVYTGFDPALVAAFKCDTILLDTWHPDERGGTGAVFDWDVAAEIRRNVARLILAGGLTVRNVASAVRKVRPDVVDVCSGVEDSPRRKNATQMREFMHEARNAAVAEAAAVAQRTA